MTDVTICFTYFRSLALVNLRAALYALRRQDLSSVKEMILVDNNTDDDVSEIKACVDELSFPMSVEVLSFKHMDPTKTHSWSTNVAVQASMTPWVVFCRADYLLHFDAVRRFVQVIHGRDLEWNGFITGNVYHLGVDVGVCNESDWRLGGTDALLRFPGVENIYTSIDAGVWAAPRAAFNRVGGLDESLSAWGHAQTHFQYKLYRSGTEFVRIPEALFFHPLHAAERDIVVAHQQLIEQGMSIQELWARYEGAKPY